MKLVCLPSEETYIQYMKSVLAIASIGSAEWPAIYRSIEEIKPYLLSRFRVNRSKYFSDNQKKEVYLRSWHYSQLVLVLHALARHLHLNDLSFLGERVYFAMVSHTSCDVFYEVDLPVMSSCDHPLGAVIGRGYFGTNSLLQFSSGCNIGNNNGVYPEIDGNLIMLPGATVVGSTHICGNVVLGKGAYLKDAGLIENKIVFGSYPQNTFKDLSLDVFKSLSMFRR